MALTALAVSARLDEVRSRIRAAGGAPDEVAVVAVTKGRGPEAVAAAVNAGLGDLGENYADELLFKRDRAETEVPEAVGESVRWHFLGHIQRNKVRRLASVVRLWQGVDRLAAGTEIARRAPGAAVLVQANVSGEAVKNGCRLEAVPALVDELRSLGLDVRGLMALGPQGPPEAARPGFRLLVATAERLGLPVRSIGMSADLEVAVQEGSTMVRVGRALFESSGAERL